MVENSTNEALTFTEFYINLIENNQKDLPFYLSSNVILDWFGKTIKTRKMVTTYFRDTIGKITHNLNDDVKFVEHVAFRDTHEIKIPKDESAIIMPSSPPFNYINSNNNNNNTTPPSTSLIKQTKPSTSSNSIEIGQGDGVQNLLMSPYKRMKLSSDKEDEDDDDDDDDDDSNDNDININSNGESIKKCIKYITASGRIQFHRPSLKKFQTERKWERPIKLHIGYTSNNFKDCTIYLIIYEGNLKCRRNLLKDFCDTDKKQLNDND